MKRGYKLIRVNGKRLDLHRHIMQQHIGRDLLPHEIVHHKNHDKNDNRIENLEIMDRSSHSKLHAKDGKWRKNLERTKEWNGNNRTSKMMVLNTSGEELIIFRSLHMVSVCCKIDQRNIWRVLKGEREHYKGFVFKSLKAA